MADPTTLSEDCLTISIFRPAGLSSKDKLPVVMPTVLEGSMESLICLLQLFWTYGGAFVIGSSNMYDGANLVTRSVARVSQTQLSELPSFTQPLRAPQSFMSTLTIAWVLSGILWDKKVRAFQNSPP